MNATQSEWTGRDADVLVLSEYYEDEKGSR